MKFVKLLFLWLFVFCLFFPLLYQKEIDFACTNQMGFVDYTGNIKNIFIHSLIAYPEILEKKSKQIIKSYDIDCIDYIEFENMLNELYKNKYVLVDISDTFYVDEKGIAHKKPVCVPIGKKPIVIGVDDVVYDPRKSGNGMVDKLCLDENEKFYTETNINGEIDKSYSREFVPILESFLQKFPDFSPKNARFCINLTGFCGILGYRVTSQDKDFAMTETEKANKVVSKLKSLGYTFACHSFGHYHIKRANLESIKNDLILWKTNIEPIIGKTNIFVYPYGEWELCDGNKLSTKQQILCDYGFKMFLGVGIYDFFGYMPLNRNVSDKVLFADRKDIDGYTLHNRKTELSSLFDANKILSEYAKKRYES